MTTTLLNPACSPCYSCDCLSCDDYEEDWYAWGDLFQHDSSLTTSSSGTYQWVASDLHTIINSLVAAITLTGPTPNGGGWDEYVSVDVSFGSVEAFGEVVTQESGYPAQSQFVRFHDFRFTDIMIKQFCQGDRQAELAVRFKASEIGGYGSDPPPITQNIEFSLYSQTAPGGIFDGTRLACETQPMFAGETDTVLLHNGSGAVVVTNPGSFGMAFFQVALPLTSYPYDPLEVFKEYDGQLYLGTTPP